MSALFFTAAKKPCPQLFTLFRLFSCLVAVLLFSFATIAKAQTLNYQLDGVSGELKENVNAYLGALPTYQTHQFRAARKPISEAVDKGLEALGYYDHQIQLNRSENNLDQVLITITLGQPATLKEVKIELLGEANQDPAFLQLLEKNQLKEGAIFHHGNYEELKSAISTLAMARGYFHGQFLRKEVRIMPDLHGAELYLTYDSGIRYHYGEIQYSAPQAAIKHVAPIVTIKKDEPYLAMTLADISQDISATRLFAKVDVKPILAEIKGNQVPISITLEPRVNHEIELGVGYATDNGLRFSSSWEKPWVNDYGHKLKSDIKLSVPESEITFDYQIPVGNPLIDYYSVQSGYQYTNENDTETSLLTVGVHRKKKGYFGWDRDTFIRAEAEDYTQGQEVGQSMLLIPGISFERLRVRGSAIPSWGDRQQLLFEFSNTAWGSDVDFFRFWGRSKWLRTLHERHRILTRFEQGAIYTDDLSEIPPSLRFFTGGDQTVRGYDFETISPTDDNGDLTGASYTTATSLEYNYQISSRWLAAAFVDVGTATNDYQDEWKVGTGIGVRWATSVGMVRLDLAVGITEEDKPVRLHFALGPEL